MELNFVHIVLVVGSFVLQFHQIETMECGTVKFIRPAILGGTETLKGEWPFVVAIYNRSNYICGGTIISYRHILTAAHCIQKKWSETELSPHDVVVRIGAFNLTNNNEKGQIQRNVSDIIMHDDWEPFKKIFDADIAILVLSENITFTDNIQPVCMPASGVTANVTGSVVGYVVRRSKIQVEIPRRIIVRSVNSSHCFREDNVVATYTSNRTFCGGNGDGSPDLGDSGSGFFFTPGFSWAQYGLVALIHTNATGDVVPHAYHVYTNLTMFKDWIFATVNRTGGEVGEARKNIILNCVYDLHTASSEGPLDRCNLYDIDIQGNDFETGSFGGSHLRRKTQQDIDEIHFVNGTMSHLPSGFGLFFENIASVTVGEHKPNSIPLGTKVVRRSDLQNLQKLRKLHFFRNDIESLHENALWHLPNLQYFVLIENKLKVLANETFSKNKKLLEVNLSSNQLDFLPVNLFRNNSALRSVDFRMNLLRTIDESIFRTNIRLASALFRSNQLEMLPKRLFQRNLYLTLVAFENNALLSIDEDLFETNVKLLRAQFSSNRIESLPPTLFRNNSQIYIVLFDNNSITTIDENLFINNEKLFIASFANNRLERLRTNVFRSTPILNVLSLYNNRLSSIAIDFTELEHVDFIDLSQNECVNARYMKRNVARSTGFTSFDNLAEFQDVVRANCTNGP